MRAFLKRMIHNGAVIAMVPILLFIPFSPGCICVEDTTLGPPTSISREYEGFMIIQDTGESVAFTLDAFWESGGNGVDGTIEIPGDTAAYELEDLSITSSSLTFSVSIPSISTLPLNFETTFDDYFLAGTFELTGGLEMGRLVSVNVEGMNLTRFEMVGAYELVTSSTDGDTLPTEYIDELSVRLEFERDGTYRAVSKVLPAGGEIVERGEYGITDNFLIVSLTDIVEDGKRLPLSMRGFVVNKDLVIISSPRPFPSFDSLVPIEDGIQVEHFKQVF